MLKSRRAINRSAICAIATRAAQSEKVLQYSYHEERARQYHAGSCSSSRTKGGFATRIVSIQQLPTGGRGERHCASAFRARRHQDRSGRQSAGIRGPCGHRGVSSTTSDGSRGPSLRDLPLCTPHTARRWTLAQLSPKGSGPLTVRCSQSTLVPPSGRGAGGLLPTTAARDRRSKKGRIRD